MSKNISEKETMTTVNGNLEINNGHKSQVRSNKKWEIQPEYEKISREIIGKKNPLDIQEDMINILRLFFKRAKVCLRKQKVQQAVKLLRMLKNFLINMHFKSNEDINLLMENPSYKELMVLLLAIYIELLFLSSGKESVSQLCYKMVNFLKMILGQSLLHIVDVLLLLHHLPQHKIWDFLLPLLEQIIEAKSPKRTPELYMKTIILIRHWLKCCSVENRKEVKKLAKKLAPPSGIRQWLQSNDLHDLSLILKETSMPTTKLLLSKKFLPDAYKKLHKEFKLTTKYSYLLREERIVNDRKAMDVSSDVDFFIDTLPVSNAVASCNDIGQRSSKRVLDTIDEETILSNPTRDMEEVENDILLIEGSTAVDTEEVKNCTSPKCSPKKKKLKTLETESNEIPKIIETSLSRYYSVDNGSEAESLANTMQVDQISPLKSSKKLSSASSKKSPRKEITPEHEDVVDIEDDNDEMKDSVNAENEILIDDDNTDDIIVKVNGKIDSPIKLRNRKSKDDIVTPVKSGNKFSTPRSTSKIILRSGSSGTDECTRSQNQERTVSHENTQYHRCKDAGENIPEDMNGDIICLGQNISKKENNSSAIDSGTREGNGINKSPSVNSFTRTSLDQSRCGSSVKRLNKFLVEVTGVKEVCDVSPVLNSSLKLREKSNLKDSKSFFTARNEETPLSSKSSVRSDEESISNVSEEEYANVIFDVSSTSLSSYSNRSSVSESSSSDSFSETHLHNFSSAKTRLENKCLYPLNKTDGECACDQHNIYDPYYEPTMSFLPSSSEFNEEIIIYKNGLNGTSLSGILNLVKEALDKKEPLEIPTSALEDQMLVTGLSNEKTTSLQAENFEIPEKLELNENVSLLSSMTNSGKEHNIPCENSNKTFTNVLEKRVFQANLKEDSSVSISNYQNSNSNINEILSKSNQNLLTSDTSESKIKLDISASPVIKRLPPISSETTMKLLSSLHVSSPLEVPLQKRPIVLIEYPPDYVLHKKQNLNQVASSLTKSHNFQFCDHNKKEHCSNNCKNSGVCMSKSKKDYLISSPLEQRLSNDSDTDVTNQQGLTTQDLLSSSDSPRRSVKRVLSFNDSNNLSAAQSKDVVYDKIKNTVDDKDDISDKTSSISEDFAGLLKPVKVVLTRLSPTHKADGKNSPKRKVVSHQHRKLIKRKSRDLAVEELTREPSVIIREQVNKRHVEINREQENTPYSIKNSKCLEAQPFVLLEKYPVSLYMSERDSNNNVTEEVKNETKLVKLKELRIELSRLPSSKLKNSQMPLGSCESPSSPKKFSLYKTNVGTKQVGVSSKSRSRKQRKTNNS